MLSPATFHDSLSLEAAAPFHVLAVGDDVAPEELDILASQIWPDCSRIGQGLLRLTPEAHLTGPWSLSPEAIVGLGLPLYLKFAYLISVPALRGEPVPQWLQKNDPMWAAFPDGGPEGLELDVLEAMRRIARRLAGALRFNTGPIIVPDPDSAVSLRILSPVWLDPAATLKLVQSVAPRAALVDDGSEPEDPLAELSRMSARQPRELRLNTPDLRANYDPEGIRAGLGLDDDERAWLHAEAEAFDEAAMSLPPMVDAFAVSVEVSNTSVIHVVVQGETVAPPALLHRGDQGFVSYELHWLTPDMAMTQENRPKRSLRLDRLTVIDTIESIARVLAVATQGVILDEDDFVVTL